MTLHASAHQHSRLKISIYLSKKMITTSRNTPSQLSLQDRKKNLLQNPLSSLKKLGRRSIFKTRAELQSLELPAHAKLKILSFDLVLSLSVSPSLTLNGLGEEK